MSAEDGADGSTMTYTYLSLFDFGARYYDAYVGRWNAIDPLAHKYFGMSPYNYCGNDPVNRFDPEGRNWYQNNDTGEYEWYAGTEDKEGYTNKGSTMTIDGTYYSLFGAVVTNKDNYPIADLYRCIDQLISKYIHNIDFQPSSPFDTELPSTTTNFDINATNLIHFVYKGANFTSLEDGTLFFPSNTAKWRGNTYNRCTLLQIYDFPDHNHGYGGRKQGEGNIDIYWEDGFWLIAQSVQQRSNPLQIRFDDHNAKLFLKDVKKQLQRK